MGRTVPQKSVSAKSVVSKKQADVSPPVFKMKGKKKDEVYTAASVSPQKASKKPKGKDVI